MNKHSELLIVILKNDYVIQQVSEWFLYVRSVQLNNVKIYSIYYFPPNWSWNLVPVC
jgi:hypothetical protein